MEWPLRRARNAEAEVAAAKLLEALGVDQPQPYDLDREPFLPTAIPAQEGRAGGQVAHRGPRWGTGAMRGSRRRQRCCCSRNRGNCSRGRLGGHARGWAR